MENKHQIKFKKLKLKELRERIGLTQKEFAQLLGIPVASLSRIETGKEFPDWLKRTIKINSVLKKFGYSIDDLFSDFLNKDS